MNILYLTKYSRSGASSRMRSFQYFSYLEQQGMRVTVKPLFSDEYLKAIYNGRKPLTLIVKSYLNRFFVLFTVFSYNRVFIEKELFPYFPAFFEWVLSIFGLRYLVDYDDAIFHNYDQHPNSVLKKLLGNKIDKVMRYSNTVIAGNNYLAERAKMAGAKNVHILPTVVDLQRYSLKEHKNRQTTIIGWIGTKSTFEKHFTKIKNLLQLALERFPVEFHVVGGTKDLDLGDRVKYLSWSEDREVSFILNFDIGIMPLNDSFWEKGKCAYKLIQYMACGLPVIASPVGMNAVVVQDNANGFQAVNETEWLAAIKKYVENVNLRRAHGLAGREMVENKFCLQVTQSQLLKIIRDDI